MGGQVTSDVHLRAHACHINIYFLCATALSSPIITRCAYTIGRPRIQKLPDKKAREPIIRVYFKSLPILHTTRNPNVFSPTIYFAGVTFRRRICRQIRFIILSSASYTKWLFGIRKCAIYANYLPYKSRVLAKYNFTYLSRFLPNTRERY